MSSLDQKSPICFNPFIVGSRDLSIGSTSSPISHLAPSGSLWEPQDYAVVAASTHCALYYLTVLAFTVRSAWEGLYPRICMAFALASFRHCSGIISHRSLPWIPHPKLLPLLCQSVFSVSFSFLYDNPHTLTIHLCLSVCTHIHIFVCCLFPLFECKLPAMFPGAWAVSVWLIAGSCEIFMEQITKVDMTLNPGLAIYWFSWVNSLAPPPPP